MFLFLIASGLSLIFGVLRVLNFAHGTFYMLGAYGAYQFVQWLGHGPGTLLAGRPRRGRSPSPSLGGIVERFLFRHLYGKEELYQLLFTYALVLILSDVAKIIWGTQQKSVSRPPGLTGAFTLFGATIPHYNLFILLLGPGHRARLLVRAAAHARRPLHPRRRARPRDAGRARRQRERALHRRVRARLVPGRPRRRPHHARCGPSCPGMDTEIIVEAFVVVVIGGLGSFWGTFLGALIYGQVLSFGILFFPRFSIFAVFALMAAVLIIRPWGLLGRPLQVTEPLDRHGGSAAPLPRERPRALGAARLAAFFVPAVGLALLHVPRQRRRHLGAVRHQPQPAGRLHRARLLRPRRLLRHRRLRHRHPHEEARACSFLLAFPAAGVIAGLFALVFGFFCVRLTRIYFAMLTLAFAQIVWAICFKWNEVTGGEQGMPEIPYPSFDWVDRVAAVLPFVGGYRTSDYFYFTHA